MNPICLAQRVTRVIIFLFACVTSGVVAAAPPALPPEALACGTQPELDSALAATEDVQLTPKIMNLAEQLNYSPARILEYVYQNIAYEPYYGSLKGAEGTLVTGTGSSTDQASLLIALLRASNIPARYVKGKILVKDAQHDALGGRVARWLGAKSYAGAQGILSNGQNPSVTSVSNQSAQQIGLTFVHVWVEACVPYSNYRGTANDSSGYRWMPLDSSFKDATYQAGIATSVAFDYAGYLAERTSTLPYEHLDQQILQAVRLPGVNPYGENNTLEDVPYKGTLNTFSVDVLPASLPYEVTEFLSWAGTTSAEIDALPASHRYQLNVIFYDNLGSPLLTASLSMPQIILGRLTLSFDGATPADQTALTNWQTDDTLGTVGSTPLPCGINTVPVLRGRVAGVDGTVIAQGSAGTPLDVCSIYHILSMSLSLSELVDPDINSVTWYDINAANKHALMVHAYQTSNRLINERIGTLLQTVKDTTNPNINLEATEGEFLNIVGLKYMKENADQARRIGAMRGGSGYTGHELGITESEMKVAYIFDMPFAVASNGFVIDIPGGVSRNVDLVTGDWTWDTFLLTGYNGSALEHSVWQENTRLDAISTVRGLQIANEASVPILTLNSANWASEVVNIPTEPGCYITASMNYSQCVLDSIKTGYIDNGFTVTLPRNMVQYGDWKGYFYVGELNNSGTSSGSAAAFLIGRWNGGHTLRHLTDPGLTGYSLTTYDSYANTGFVTPNPSRTFSASLPPGSTSSPQPLVTNSGPLNNGFDPRFMTTSGGVNLANGNSLHHEEDVMIPGRGELPLMIQRVYNSRNPQNGPFGYGWTHNYNHSISFKDDDANNVVDTADTNDLTSSVVWIDGTGGEKLFQVNGTASGVAIGSAFTRVPGTFATMTRNANGTYTVRETNGMSYVFENVAGTENQTAKLQSISDRNGNTVTLNYTSACGLKLCSVTDGAGRSLNFTYDANNHITAVSDWTGRQFQYRYTDGNNNLNEYLNPLAVAGQQPAVTYEYFTDVDGVYINHAMKKHTRARGNSTRYEYYANGRLFRKFDAYGNERSYRYNDFRRETVEINERGYSQSYQFDQYGNTLKSVRPNGAVDGFTYDYSTSDTVYNRITHTDPQQLLTQYAYDASGNVTSITHPSASTQTFSNFTAFNQPGKVKDANGHYTVLKYDVKGNLLQKFVLKDAYCSTNNCTALNPAAYTPAATDMLYWRKWGYDGYGNKTSDKIVRNFATEVTTPSNTTPNGPVLSYVFDANGLYPVSVARSGKANADVTVTTQTASVSYDNLGRAALGINDNWYSQTFNWNSHNQRIEATDSFGKQRSYEFDDNGNVIGERLLINNQLHDSRYADFDDLDRKTMAMDAGGNITYYDYDAGGNLVQMTDPDNYQQSFEYDAANYAVKYFDQLNNFEQRSFDLSGKPRSATDRNGNPTTYTYYGSTQDGRLQTKTDAANHVQEFDYDANGNATRITTVGADGTTQRSSVLHYDELNRQTRRVGPTYTDATLGSIRPVTTFAYNSLGQLENVSAGYTPELTGLIATQDVLTTQRSFTYDDYSRRISEADGLSHAWQFRYDSNNNLTTATDPLGQITTYSWTYGNQLASLTDDDAQTYTYTRNHLGQITRAVSPLVTYDFTYDASHRLQTITDSRGPKTLTYNYSPGGLLNNLEDSDQRRTDYFYDPTGRLTGVWAPNFDYIGYGYDAAGRLRNKWVDSGVNADYSYNTDNTLASITNKHNSITISSHVYGYDTLANRNTHAETINGTTINYVYGYDELNRLIQVTNGNAAQQENYTYDPLNNRTTQTIGTTTTAYVYDAANQLQDIHAGTATGTLLADLNYDANGNLINRSDIGATYTYDARNRLIQVAQTGITTQTYGYDDQGRRISKTIGANTQHYLYNGMQLIEEYANNWTSTPTQYTHGARIDEIVIKQTAAAAQYYHQDGLNSLVAITSNTGTTDATQKFNAWGNINAATGVSQYFGYTGREKDETGLMYYRARYYAPDLGRFTQQDPIGLRGGMNIYAYSHNSPINFNDPHGLDTQISIGFTETGVPGFYHQVVILTDTVTGQQIATRAGPAPNEINGQGTSGTGSNPLDYGDIYAQTYVYDVNFPDTPQEVGERIQEIGIIERDFSEAVANAYEFSQITNDNGIGYFFLGPNSNSYASTFLESLLGFRPIPFWISPGWYMGYPSTRLSYKSSKLLGGGATIGGLLQD